MGAVTDIKNYVAKHSYKESRQVKRIKGSLYQPSYFDDPIEEYTDTDFESVSESAFTREKLHEKNVPGWRPGSLDEIPYE